MSVSSIPAGTLLTGVEMETAPWRNCVRGSSALPSGLLRFLYRLLAFLVRDITLLSLLVCSLFVRRSPWVD